MTVSSELAYLASTHGMSVDAYTAYIDKQNGAYLDKIKEIDVPSISPKRRLNQPKFKLAFDTREDLWNRIGNTFIWVGPHIFCVENILEWRGDYWLVLTDDKGGHFKAPYKANSLIDLRSPEPQYLNLDGAARFITRKPDRQFLQGMSRGNTYVKNVGHSRYYRLDTMWEIIPGLRETDSLTWQTSFFELLVKSRALKALRLSPCIAFYRDKQDRLVAEYRGRPIGLVTDDCVEMDERDHEKPWIKQDFHEIGCSTRKAKDAPALEATDL